MTWRAHLDMIPEHMRDSISEWIEHGEPHPSLLGHFMRSLLTNDLMYSFAYADSENMDAMGLWLLFLYNYAPADCFGSSKKLEAWHAKHRQREG